MLETSAGDVCLAGGAIGSGESRDVLTNSMWFGQGSEECGVKESAGWEANSCALYLDRRLLLCCLLGVVVGEFPCVGVEIWFFSTVCPCLGKEKQGDIYKVHFCRSWGEI